MLARAATSTDARLIQYELAGRYSVKAAGSAETPASPQAVGAVRDMKKPAAGPSPSDFADEFYYRQLAEGARYLASGAPTLLAAAEHHRMATRYMRLSREAVRARCPAP
jgi:hypothetical protein